MTSVTNEPLKGEKIKFSEDGMDFEYMAVNGIGFPNFPAFLTPESSVKRVEEIRSLDFRPDDIILATYPKCGTHWTNEILNMLVRQQADYHKLPKATFMLELVPNIDLTRNIASPRVLNTHVMYEWLPRQHIENGGKIVHVTRNPKDAYVSYFYHSKKSLEHGPETKDMSWTQFFNSCILQQRDLCYFYVLTIFSNTLYLNLFFLQDPIKEITALGDFLGIKMTDELSKEIAEKCNFENLKKADQEVKEIPKELMAEFMKFRKENAFKGEMPQIYRKGIVGDWKNMFTVAQNEQFDKMFNEEMRDIDLDVVFKIN
ncbi:hypothetical protein FSP39_002106 [Pinctada imbricata]|uniref:Sulfotransferase domain-containing protein n=1 Tax=Pinctada imbricata TaxID=66713 RepID=A0AA88YAA7_PINIB|nr:hypothetical protein FSP39_002106 [Pinctada imbricata]